MLFTSSNKFILIRDLKTDMVKTMLLSFRMDKHLESRCFIRVHNHLDISINPENRKGKNSWKKRGLDLFHS